MWGRQMMTRRGFLRRLIKIGISVSVLTSPLYAHFVERKWFGIHRLTLRFPDLPQSFHGMKLALFSDTHIGFYFGCSELQNVVQCIQHERPDLICFAGDLMDNGIEPLEACMPILLQLDAPLGKVAVLGNHDFVPDPTLIRDKLEQCGFTVLNNESVVLKSAEQETIRIAGLRDVFYDKPDLSLALSERKDGEFTIVMVHEPDIADETAQHDVQLQLSGHTHGGQIRIPLIGHLYAPPFGEKYVDRLNQVPNSSLKVYTTRGVGTTGVPLRFFCRPEIAVLQLERA